MVGFLLCFVTAAGRGWLPEMAATGIREPRGPNRWPRPMPYRHALAEVAAPERSRWLRPDRECPLQSLLSPAVPWVHAEDENLVAWTYPPMRTSYSSTETSLPPAWGISSSFQAATLSALSRSSSWVLYSATVTTFPVLG